MELWQIVMVFGAGFITGVSLMLVVANREIEVILLDHQNELDNEKKIVAKFMRGEL